VTDLPAVYAPLYSAMLMAGYFLLEFVDFGLYSIRITGSSLSEEVKAELKQIHRRFKGKGWRMISALPIYEILVGQTQFVLLLCLAMAASKLLLTTTQLLISRSYDLQREIETDAPLPMAAWLELAGAICATGVLLGTVAGLIAYFL
jgi:hypothetical protein